jgi:hypothetical protein
MKIGTGSMKKLMTIESKTFKFRALPGQAGNGNRAVIRFLQLYVDKILLGNLQCLFIDFPDQRYICL